MKRVTVTIVSTKVTAIRNFTTHQLSSNPSSVRPVFAYV